MEGKPSAYILRVFFPALRVLNHPPKVTGKVNSAALVWLLEKLASVQSCLGDKSVVVLLGEATSSVQSTGNDADCLELCTRIADGIFIDRECLRKKLIADLFETGLVCNFTTHHKQAKRQIRTAWIYPLVQIVDTLVHKSVKC